MNLICDEVFIVVVGKQDELVTFCQIEITLCMEIGLSEVEEDASECAGDAQII